jgi:PKD repeat protein
MEIPLMCTVFFSNYGSSIYGKQNNKWILKDSETDREILNVKNTPYFIYTFVKAGYYTIYNSVEDAYGNVYEISKNAFITVIDHTIKKPNDINPFLVDSTDYGYPLPPAGDKSDIKSLGDEIERDKIEFMKNKQAKFSSPLIIKDSSDATFNQ